MNPDAEVVRATIVADLPQRLFRLQTENGTAIVAGLAPRVQRLGTKFKPGDSVRVRPASHDKGRGTIIGLTVEPPPTHSGSPAPCGHAAGSGESLAEGQE